MTSQEQQLSTGVTVEQTIEKVKAKLFKDIEKATANIEGVNLDLVSLGPWSFSKYKALKKCPFQFYLKYILKVKLPEEALIQSDPISANVGKAAHEILEMIMAGKSVDHSYAAVKKSYIESKALTEKVWIEKVDTLNYNITKFKEKIDQFERLNPIKRTMLELRIGVTRDFQPTGFFSNDVWLRGVLDLALFLESLDAIILDHKTGGNAQGIKNYEEQLDWYKVLIHFGIQEVSGVQTGIHFIQEGEVKMASYSDRQAIENKLKHVIEMSIEGAIDMLKEHGYFKHIRGPHCKWCEYDNAGCKSGELKQLELSTKKWLPINQI